jgi:N-acetylmuramic acid 6-phosphate etherase
MIKTGKVYGNLMVDLRATNFKLQDRSERIITDVTGLSRPAAKKLLKKARGFVKAAIVMHFKKVSLGKAIKILRQCNESLRTAIGK